VVLFAAGLSIGISNSPHQFQSSDLGIGDAGNGYHGMFALLLMVRPPSADNMGCQISLRDRKGIVVIQLTRLNGNPIALNSDLIKFVENAPDTVITLINGEKIIVRETSDDVIHRILGFRRAVMAGLPSWSGTEVNSATLHPQENHPNRPPEAFRRG
jgi:flagellar protein FlbD